MTFEQVAAFDNWELAHWIAKLRREPPVTAALLDVMQAQICAVIAKTGFRGLRPDDVQGFLLRPGTPPPTREQRQAALKAWVRSFEK